MRILFATGSPASYMAPPRLAAEQVNCGPDWVDRQSAGEFVSLSTPVGEYDLAAIAKRLPPEQKPDAVVCLVDASWRNLPRNLRAFHCPKVLLIADTHHLTQPLTRMITYARSEPFDRIVLLYDRHHYTILRDAGLESLFWFPGLTFPHEDLQVTAARSEDRTAQISFVGQLGICHPQRLQLLNCLSEQRLRLQIESVSQTEALGFYGRSLIGFNASLNGDLNLRTFEIMASGAMLLTDRLAPPSGLLELWTEGRDLMTYGSRGELAERARYALQNPEATREIGRAGAAWFDRHFAAEERRRIFAALVNDGIAPAAFPLPVSSPRPIQQTGARPAAANLAAYEYVQELHRNTDQVSILIEDGVAREFLEMTRTLPRVQLGSLTSDHSQRCDLAVVRTGTALRGKLPPAASIWCCDAVEKDRVALVRQFAALGLTLQPGDFFLFARRQVNTHKNHGALALTLLEQGDYQSAFRHAREELARNPQSVPALLALAELSQEIGQEQQALVCLTRLKALAPFDVRLQRLLNEPKDARRHRRSERLIRSGLAHTEQRDWAKAERCASDALTLRPKWAPALRLLARIRKGQGTADGSINFLNQALAEEPACVETWKELGHALLDIGRKADALSAYVYASILDPSNLDIWSEVANAAGAVGHDALERQAMTKVLELAPERIIPKKALTPGRDSDVYSKRKPLDLLLCHVEVTRLQGTGVLIKRFFPDSNSFVTLRSRTLYCGETEFGSLSLSVDLPALPLEGRRQVVERLLESLHVRRILSVPFFHSDFEHTITAKALTGAPLCVYAMDDQTLYSSEVSRELAGSCFRAAELRLAISPEMVREYTNCFELPFGLLPPIITNRLDEVPNHWVPDPRTAKRCVMVGNIWSAQQFEQLRAFLRAANLTVDWYGNSKVAWLPQDHGALERDGIVCRGFVPEDILATRIAAYPFVLIPSGSLDGSEDNEWLTRLSLPSRMVFILTKTKTPMLIVGHSETAAARFVETLGLGVSSNYDPTEAAIRIEELTSASARSLWLERANRAAEAFLFPECGDWIWKSLAARQPLPTPFDSLLPTAPDALTAV